MVDGVCGSLPAPEDGQAALTPLAERPRPNMRGNRHFCAQSAKGIEGLTNGEARCTLVQVKAPAKLPSVNNQRVAKRNIIVAT